MIAAIAFTAAGQALGQRLSVSQQNMTVTRCPNGGLGAWTATHFQSADALVFISSIGLAVRAIADHVVSKTTDPAVVVVDEQGRFAVPILSGHIGQANTLARQIADELGSVSVITTATDGRGLFAVDDWATRQGLRIANPERIKTVSAALLAGQPVRLASEFPVLGPLPPGVGYADETRDIAITCRTIDVDDQALHLIPPAVTAGIGCRKGISATAITRTFRAALNQSAYHPLSVAEVCSIDIKADEPGLVAFCQQHGLPLRTFSAGELRDTVGDFTSSEFVASTVGVDNVCERAAVLGSGGYLVAHRFALDGVTVALAVREPTLSFDTHDLGQQDEEA